MARLLDLYKNDIAKAMAAKFNHDNPMAIPKLTKIVINMGVGKATQDKALLESAVDSLSKISGQKPVVTKAKISVSGLPAPRGKRHRLQGHAARPADVRVPRPADLDRPAAYSRLSRRQPQQLRRPRQLQPGPGRAGRLPRDRRRQDAAHPRHGYHDRDDRGRTTTRPASCCTTSACRSASRQGPREVSGTRCVRARGRFGKRSTDLAARVELQKTATRLRPIGSFPGVGEPQHVDQGPEDQVGDAAQVCGSASEPLPLVRASPRLLPQVRRLPDLLPEPGPPRPDSGCQEGELVSRLADRCGRLSQVHGRSIPAGRCQTSE